MINFIREEFSLFLVLTFMFVIIPIGAHYADNIDKDNAINAFHTWEKAYGNPNKISYEEFCNLKNYQNSRSNY